MKTAVRHVPILILLALTQFFGMDTTVAQSCSSLTATFTTTASNCTATGSITINASGGSGTYNYKVVGPVTTAFTSSNVIDGLQSGTYDVIVKDIVSNCTFATANVVVPGAYIAPTFGLTETDVTCTNGSDGTIAVSGMANGLAPFTFTLVAPSPAGVGTSNTTGSFTGLPAGAYSVQLTDSCGDIQTRVITIQNYSWSFYSTSVTLSSCTSYNARIVLLDSKGNVDTTGTAFSGFQYGVATAPGDTSWFPNYSFTFDLGQSRSIALVAKDRCGLVHSVPWSNTIIPSLGANVTTGSLTCTGFNAAVMNPLNLTSPNYCLVTGSGHPLAGQPCNATGAFTNIPYGEYCIVMTNSCYDTVITRCFYVLQNVPAITGAVALSAYTCTGATATVTGQKNLTSPQYCLFNASGTAVGSCNTTGVFTNVPYGSYTIQVTDGCTGNVLSVSFTSVKGTPSVAAAVQLTGNSCSTFNGAITGSTNLISPQYCLMDSLGNTITCNSTGAFTGLAYGSYCIDITDACNDTTITRCFHQYIPAVSGGSAAISNKTCKSFTVTISGEGNVFNGQYCLQDAAGNPVGTIPCNSTGVFNYVPYGAYCIKTTDACSNTTNTVCFTEAAPTPSVGSVSISNKTCAGFTATQTGQQYLSSPTYCLFDSLDNQVGSCNSTGVFSVTGYGSYTLQTTDSCSTFSTPFTAIKPVPSVNTAVNFSNQTCTTFTAGITGQTNLTSPQYTLLDNAGTALTTNSTGTFTNIAYGSYCIDITDACMDTTIVRCFTTSASPVQMTVAAAPSCTYNASDLTVKITTGFGPYTISVYDTLGNLVRDTITSSTTVTIQGLTYMPSAATHYRVIVDGSCGIPDTSNVVPVLSSVNRGYTIVPQCPSSITLNGSGSLEVVAAGNLSGLNASITQLNFIPDAISYSYHSGNDYTFSNLVAGTYVLTYTFGACSTRINDTVTVPNYSFPALDKSAAFQCNDNSFTISAAATGGIGPFTYQIIGSEPDSPGVSSVTQSSPLFSINNGTQYSLVRLRAVDACGNSALSDVEILPLQNTVVTASVNCLYQSSTLSVDPVPNATYNWYYKTSAAATDSTLVGTGISYTIPSLQNSDTGVYINKLSINSGCLTQLSYIDLNGSCGGTYTVLALNITLTGAPAADDANLLTWSVSSNPSIQQFILQRSGTADGNFIPIGTISANPSLSDTLYGFEDTHPLDGANFYRLAIVHPGSFFTYTNIVSLNSSLTGEISVYPNPAVSQLTVGIHGIRPNRYAITLYSTSGQLVTQMESGVIQAGNLTFQRTAAMKPGIYFLTVNNIDSGESKVFKITFD
jgi:hypothetical protein